MKPKQLLLTCLLAIVGSMAGQKAFAYTAKIDGIYYDFYAGKAIVTYKSFNGSDYTGAVVIPSSVYYDGRYFPVTYIGYKAFYDCSGLTSVNIPNSVTSIGDNAFSGCSGLTSVNIPGSVTSIDIYAFYNCTGLTSVTIPNSVTYIGGSVFEDCTGLTSVNIGNSVTEIYANAFSGCSRLTSVNIPNSVTNIDSNAFSGCSGLTSVNIGNSVTEIGDYAFSGCSGLTSVNIPNSVTDIYPYAFYDCSGLTSITIGNGVTSIGKSAFQECSSLTSVTIPNSVTSIGDGAFYGTGWYKTQPDGILYLDNWLLGYKRTKPTGNVTINSGTRGIADKAFYGCSGLTSVNIPYSVTSIGYQAFRGCSGLTSVNIPYSVTSIGDEAFYNCSDLTSVNIPGSVTYLGNHAFYGCSMTDVYCFAKNVPTTEGNPFDSSYKSATLHVPAASIVAYSTTEPWKGFGDIVDIGTSEDPSELSNNRQYLIHTRNKIRGSLGVTDNHLASTNPAAYGPWVCRPVVLDRNNPLITNVNQLSSPYTEPSEGSLDAMIDGNTETFWHSVWSQGAVEAGSHYFQVEMPNQANTDVAFKVTRRQADNDHITEWGVYGTNNANATKANCTKLAVIETPYNNRGETRVSDIFKTGGYKYLRFYINRTTRSNFGHLAEFQLYPASYDEAHRDASPFAIIQKDGGYYLYSVLDKAFITPWNNGDENTNPLLPSDNKMDIYPYINDADIYFVFDFIDTGYTINVNFDPGIAIDDYGTLTNRFDDGNLFTIEEVGYFDPTEALAKFETQTFTVTYKVMFDGKEVAKATELVASGDPLPPAPASLSNSFITLTKTGTPPTTVTGDVTVTYNATWKGPFKFTKTVTNAKWYNMHIRSGYYVGKQETEPYYPTRNVDEATLATPAYQWAFGGDPYHVKVYNRTTGLSGTLTKDSNNAVMRSGDYTWDLLPNNGGFVLRVTGTEYSCINQYGSTSGPLQFWTNSKALTDDGSTFRVEEVIVPPSSDLVINDETTSLNIETEGSGRKVEFTHAFNGDWEALYLPFAIDYDAIKANFDLAEIDGVVQNDDNNDGTPDITVLSIIGFKGQMTEPNTPYLIRAKNAGEQTIVFDDVTLYPTESASIDCSSTSIRYEFTGSYNTLNASALANRYVVQGGELVKGASTLAPCRWYMTATARKGSLNLPNKIRIMPVEDVITGSLLLTSPKEEGLIYDVSGQRISASRHGLNIIRFSDGTSKKVLVK